MTLHKNQAWKILLIAVAGCDLPALLWGGSAVDTVRFCSWRNTQELYLPVVEVSARPDCSYPDPVCCV